MALLSPSAPPSKAEVSAPLTTLDDMCDDVLHQSTASSRKRQKLCHNYVSSPSPDQSSP